MDRKFVLALDIGTSSVRAILFDARGRAVKSAGGDVFESQVKYSQTTTADGGVEVDADRLVTLTIQCITSALSKIGQLGKSICAVGISCFWHSLLGVNANDRAVTPVFSWADTRSASFVSKLSEHFDQESYHDVTGAELHPCFWPAKLLWLCSTRPELFEAKTRWMGYSEYLFLRLFGKAASSTSMASGTGLFSQQLAGWDSAVLTKLSIDRSLLPAVSDLPQSGVSNEFRARMKGLADIPWFPAAGDGACSNIGSGGVDERRIVLNIGTSAAMRIVVPSRKDGTVRAANGLFCYRVDEQNLVMGGAFANGGNVYAWLKETMNWSDDSALSRQAAKVLPDSHGLTVLPFWAGERSPNWRANARASIFGMNLHTTTADIVRASLEGCAYSFESTRRKLLEQFSGVENIVVSGGAAASSPLLTQIVSDVFGQPLVSSRVAEASSRGAALLALRGIGAIKALSDVPFEKGRIFYPDMENYRRYQLGVARYADYYDTIASLER